MKKPLRTTLSVIAGAAAALALGGLILTQVRSCQEAERRAAELLLYPAEQVEAARAHQQLLREADAILASRNNDEEKIAELNALLPRMKTIGVQLWQMSSYRLEELQLLLGFEDEELETLAATLEPYAITLEKTPEPTPLSETTMHFVRSAARPASWDATPEQTADALLRHAEEVSTARKREGLSPAEQLEMLRLHYELLVNLCVPLYIGEDKGLAHRLALEELLQQRPEDVERLNRHMAEMTPTPPAPSANDEEADTLNEIADKQKAYHSFLREALVLSLRGLTAEGQRELDELAAFLSAEESDGGATCVLCGSYNIGFWVSEDKGCKYDMHLRPRGENGAPSDLMLSLRLKGGETAYDAFEEQFCGDILLRVPCTALNIAQGRVEGELGMECFRELPGSWGMLEYLLKQRPELRERLFFPPPAPESSTEEP